MEDRLQQISASQFLKDYAAGAMVRATKPISTVLAPVVPVGNVVGNYKRYTRDSRLTLPRTHREIGGQVVELAIDLSDEKYECAMNALDVPIDGFLGANLEWLIPDALDLLSETEGQVIEFEAIDLAFSAAGAGADMDFGDANDPIKLIDAQLLALAKQARSDGLGVSFGPGAWGAFKSHPKVIARGGGGSLSWETHPNLFHAGARFETCYSLVDTSKEGVAEAIDFMFPTNSILLTSRLQNPTRRSPDFMKTFRLRPELQTLKVTMSADGRIYNVQNDWAVDLKVTNDEGVSRFNVVGI